MPQGKRAILGVKSKITSLPRLLQKESFNCQCHAAEGIICYARQAQIGIRTNLSAGNVTYWPGRV